MSSALRKLSRAQSHFRRTVSWALLLALLGCTGSFPGALAAPRGSKYGEDLGRNSFIGARKLHHTVPQASCTPPNWIRLGDLVEESLRAY